MIIEKMSIKQKIGQLIVCGFLNPYYDEQIKKLVDDYYLGNVILFSRNYKNPSQLKALNKEIYHHIEEKTGLLPLVAIDQEGGQVTRLMNDVTFPPSPMTTSATSFSSAPYITGKAIARDMIMLGLNWDLAPCLEINKDLGSFLHNVRSYGASREIVSKNVSGFIKGLSEYGVLSCLKHYPGSGDTTVDSHLDLPVMATPLSQIIDNNLVPFKENTSAKSVMTAHVIFRDIDKDYPSTLSSKVIKGILRDKLHFNGIVVSDGIEMKAISNYYGTGRGAALALINGCDMVLCCHNLDEQVECFNEVYKAYNNGELTEREIDEKLERIIKAKEELKPFLDKYFYNDNEYVIDRVNDEKIKEIVDKSVTLVKGNIPTLKSDTMVLAPKAVVASIVEDEFNDRNLAKALQKNFSNLVYEYNDSDTFKETALNSAENLGEVIMFTYDAYRDKSQSEIISELIKLKKDKAYLITLKGPMDANIFSGVINHITLYEYTPNSIKTIIKLLNNNLIIQGKLPK